MCERGEDRIQRLDARFWFKPFQSARW
jgi:hypothetical protein